MLTQEETLLQISTCSGKLSIKTVFIGNDYKKVVYLNLEDQHMEWKPAGQPEHASLKQCQLIVANRCSGHPQQVVEIRFLCNVIDAGALIGPCSHVTSCCCLIS